MTPHARAAVILCLAMASPSAFGEIAPTPGSGDPHLQSVAYDPEQVVALRLAAGFALTIALAPDERIETVTLGDSAGWQVQATRRGDQIVVKPVGGFATNLTLVSDQRVYHFTLYATAGNEAETPYFLTFRYPPTTATGESVARAPVGRYRLGGDSALWPQAISDDGVFTAIVWPADVALPVVYQEDKRGHPGLVNGVMRDGAYRIEGVHRKLIFRLGRAHASATRVAGESAAR